MKCPNCETPNPNAHQETQPHCTGCGANLFAKKYVRAEDPTTQSKRIEEQDARIKKLEEDNATIRKHLEERESEDATRDKRTKRTLFGN